MFAVFDAHAEVDALLMFNTGPEHGEGTSTFTFKDEPLYLASLASPRSTELCLTVAASRSFAIPRTTRGAVAERLGCAGASGPVALIFWGTLAIASRHLPRPPWVIIPRSGTYFGAANVTLFSDVPGCCPARGKVARN